MLKMILADDESIVRDGLRSIIDWKTHGIEIIAEASDGQEAFDLCMKHLPDILLTDIRMPFMDGLEVAAKLKEHGNNLKVIIFSGVQDFGYAKSALDISAEGYILKPLEVKELTQVVDRVVKKIANEKLMVERVHQLKQQLHENFGAAREKFLKNLVLGAYQKAETINEKLDYFKNPIRSEEPVAVAVLQVDEYAKKTEHYAEEEKQLLSFSITSIVEELINLNTLGACVAMNENEYVLMFHERKTESQDEQSDFYSEIVRSLNQYLQLSVSIGVGRIANSPLKINSSYKEAVNALYFKFYTGKGAVINITDISLTLENNEIPDLYLEEHELVNRVKSGNVLETEQAIQALFNKLSHDKKYTVGYIQRVCDEIVYMMTRALYDLGEDIKDITHNRSDLLKMLYQTESIFELQKKITDILISIAQHFSLKYTQKNKKVIDDIKKLIQKKYREDININKIAESVYLSPNYISVVFKQMTGETIIDFLTKTRMENAKILLKETDFKVLDISEMVGFQDASYFSKVFKKYTGVHPQKYRAIGHLSEVEE